MKRIAGAGALCFLMVLCFSIAPSDPPTESPRRHAEHTNACGTEGDTCPMPWPPTGRTQWPTTGHEGN